MRYFNSDDIRKFNENVKTAGATVILENASISKKASSQKCDVFLSHSSKDKDDLPAVIEFLKRFGVKAYVDKADDDLPKKTTSETGKIIKNRIAECKKFIVLVSDNSKESKWIPWELGIGDEKKSIDNVALLPKSDDSSSGWPEQEYLGLYPRIVYNTFKGQDSPVWMVLDHHNNKGTELSKWLKQ